MSAFEFMRYVYIISLIVSGTYISTYKNRIIEEVNYKRLKASKRKN